MSLERMSCVAQISCCLTIPFSSRIELKYYTNRNINLRALFLDAGKSRCWIMFILAKVTNRFRVVASSVESQDPQLMEIGGSVATLFSHTEQREEDLSSCFSV